MTKAPRELRLYHNPRCGKSRAALALLEAKGLPVAIIRYLDAPPSLSELRTLLKKLDIRPREMMRTKEKVYKELALDRADLSDTDLLQAMAEHPILIERPILVSGDKAVIGRPPERVLDIL